LDKIREMEEKGSNSSSFSFFTYNTFSFQKWDEFNFISDSNLKRENSPSISLSSSMESFDKTNDQKGNKKSKRFKSYTDNNTEKTNTKNDDSGPLKNSFLSVKRLQS
jgi:hypothetical protein